MILHEGAWNGSQILSKETVALISMNQIVELLGPTGGFGLGSGMIRDTQIHSGPRSTGQLNLGGYFRTHFL